MLLQGEDEGFPIVFDINLAQSQAQARLRYLEDGLFIDNATDVLKLRLVSYNGKAPHDLHRNARSCAKASCGLLAVKLTPHGFSPSGFPNPTKGK